MTALNHLPRTLIVAFLLLVIADTANAQNALIANVTSRNTTSSAEAVAPLSRPSIRGRQEKQKLMDLLKGLDLPEDAYNEAGDQQWNKLAGLFTRLRLYPLAMKCFLRTMPADSAIDADLPVTDKDEQTIKDQLKLISYDAKPQKCDIINVKKIMQTFQDGKQALAYAMVFHVKQAIRGKNATHKLAYTGHTFITLIKFNTDSSYATLSFGFGPNKDNLLSATPLAPTTTSKFTNDSGHAWDEVVGKFISRRRFEKILRLTEDYSGLDYNLSSNNCTDFGLKAAHLAGLEVQDTKNTWLLGGGNNPGSAGQSILLGKFNNRDTGNLDRLFIDTARITPTVNRAIAAKE